VTADLVERVWVQVAARLNVPVVPLEASGRHVHLSCADADVLLGAGVPLTRVRSLSQPGQFACAEKVRVIGPKGEFPAVTVIGPERAYTQVELSATDALALGVKPPLRMSGSVAGSPGLTLAGPAGQVTLPEGAVIAQRHIHMDLGFGARFGFHDGQVVAVRVWGDRGLTFDNVVIRLSPDFTTYMHIDHDEANACGFRSGLLGTIIT